MLHSKIFMLLILVFTVSSCNEMVYEPQYAEVVNVKQYVSLREKPDVKSQVMCKIPKGKWVEIMLFQNDGWAHVKYDEQYGYVKSQYLRLLEHENEQVVEKTNQTSNKSLISNLIEDVKNSWWPKILLLFMILSPLLIRFSPNEYIANIWFKLWVMTLLLIPAPLLAMIWIKLALYLQHFLLWVGQLPFLDFWGQLVEAINSKTIMFIYTFCTMGIVYFVIVIVPFLPLLLLYEAGKGKLVLKVFYGVYMSAIIIGTVDPDYTNSMPNLIADLCRWFQSSWNIHLSEYSNQSDFAVIDTVTILSCFIVMAIDGY